MAAVRLRRAHAVASECITALFVGLWLPLLLAACAANPTPPSNSGIEGQILIGPMCPVIQAGTPCPDQPYQATLLVLDSGGHRVTEVQSDALGQFKLPLPPGDYTLVPQSPDGFTHAAEQHVTVVAGQYALVSIVYDSGIR
jgi:hypothetical protein